MATVPVKTQTAAATVQRPGAGQTGLTVTSLPATASPASKPATSSPGSSAPSASTATVIQNVSGQNIIKQVGGGALRPEQRTVPSSVTRDRDPKFTGISSSVPAKGSAGSAGAQRFLCSSPCNSAFSS